MSSGPTNETAASDSSDSRTPGAGTEVAPDNAAWQKKVEDDNAFLRQQMAETQSSMDLLLTRLPQPMAKESFCPEEKVHGL